MDIIRNISSSYHPVGSFKLKEVKVYLNSGQCSTIYSWIEIKYDKNYPPLTKRMIDIYGCVGNRYCNFEESDLAPQEEE